MPCTVGRKNPKAEAPIDIYADMSHERFVTKIRFASPAIFLAPHNYTVSTFADADFLDAQSWTGRMCCRRGVGRGGDEVAEDAPRKREEAVGMDE